MSQQRNLSHIMRSYTVISFGKFPKSRKGGISSIILALILAVPGCQGYSVTGGPRPLVSDPLTSSASPELPSFGLRSLVVFPLDNGTATSLSDEELKDLTKLLVGEIQANSSLSVLNLTEEKNVSSAIESAQKKLGPVSTQAQSLGRALNAQSVLYGTIVRYAPISGTSAPESPFRFEGTLEDVNADQPQDSLRGAVASPKQTLPGGVGFRLTLLDPKNGRALWNAIFDLQERNVAENLLQLSRQVQIAGSRAELERIAQFGFRSAVKDLENSRKTK